MTKVKPQTRLTYNAEQNCLLCEGPWSITRIDHLQRQELPALENSDIVINGKDITHFDSAGAFMLRQIIESLKKQGKKVQLEDFTDRQTELLDLLDDKKEVMAYQVPPAKPKNILYRIGKETMCKLTQADGFIILLGDLATKIFDALGHWRRFRLPGIASNIDSAGIQALPIVGLLAFLIGVVLAYQMGLQLQTYGANIFIAYLSGMAIFREFGPLITAIIVAGRTSSAFTAQIGTMKVNEEIDALNTMGLSPTELLVMPKVFGLLLVFPLLIFWADLFSILGAMFMSKSMLGVGYYDFLARLKDSVGVKQFLLGLYKAPAFALLIAMVGCYQGFLVQSNSDSIGSQTTRSVVQSLFLIIIADAAFSVIYSWMGI
ncbi:ABC transporter permease [Legionella dresdenensis]|uniref:ABC transporter permease n=1 Tax=Legionella dresdenensis TaxID=450200 RepID=A0ABV8CCW3_9GAMM